MQWSSTPTYGLIEETLLLVSLSDEITVMASSKNKKHILQRQKENANYSSRNAE